MSQTRVECPKCGYSAPIDASRIPPGGARVRCPKCAEQFALHAPSPASRDEAATRRPPEPEAPPPPAPVLAAPADTAPAPPAQKPPAAAARPSRGAPDKDQRSHARVPFAVDILVNKGSMMRGIDIGEGGVYVHTGRSFNPGSLIEMELPLGEDTITVKGSVQHNQTSIGMGIKFVDLTEAQLGALRDFLAGASRGGKSVGPSRKKLLLIDEDSMKRRMNKSKLMLEGFVVVDFEDAQEALRHLEEEAPDLVVFDLFLRSMDGFKVLAIIRESPTLSAVPIVIYSSKGSDEIMGKAMAAGATEFHLKVMTPPAKLADIVKRIVSAAGR